MVVGYVSVVLLLFLIVHYFASFLTCNANEDWQYGFVERIGHSDWLVKNGWYIFSDLDLQITVDSTKVVQAVAKCQTGRLTWPKISEWCDAYKKKFPMEENCSALYSVMGLTETGTARKQSD